MEENEAKKGMNPMMIIAGVVVLAIIGVGAYFMMGSSTNTEGPEESMMEETTEAGDSMMEASESGESMMADENGVKVFEVSGSNFKFSTTEIRVNEGDKVRVVFTSTQGTHDWGVDEFDATTDIVNTGEKAEIEFTADKAGEFEYYCSVGNHRAQGMVGKLIVE